MAPVLRYQGDNDGYIVDNHPVIFGVSLQHVPGTFPLEDCEKSLADLFSWESVKWGMQSTIEGSLRRNPSSAAPNADDYLVILTKLGIFDKPDGSGFEIKMRSAFEVQYVSRTDFSRWKICSRIWLEAGYQLADKGHWQELPSIRQMVKARVWQEETYRADRSAGASFNRTMRSWFSLDTAQTWDTASHMGDVVRGNLPANRDRQDESKWNWPNYAPESTTSRNRSTATGSALEGSAWTEWEGF